MGGLKKACIIGMGRMGDDINIFLDIGRGVSNDGLFF
jgi:hypothetical protein